MFDLSKHPYFTKYTDPKSGVESYILTKKVAEVQQSFYFAQPSVTKDGKYLWIMCSYPPARYRTLAVVSLDPDNPFIRHFPHAAPTNLPCITPEGDGVYFASVNSVCKVDLEGNISTLITVGGDILKNRQMRRLFSHASVSCDGERIVLDMQISDKIYLATGNLKTGEINLITKFGRMYNHAMFSPNDPDLILIDQDCWRDYHTGEYFPIDNRMWLINTDATRFEPIVPNMFYGRDGTEMAHDYWSADGYVCWSDYYNGAYECNIETREMNLVWKRPVCHSHFSSKRDMIVADQTPYFWKEKPCQLLFYDRATDKEIEIFSSMPTPKVERGWYHLDPHPQFCADDSIVVSTTTVRDGEADVAITPVKAALELCRESGTPVSSIEYEPHPIPGWAKRLKTTSYD